MHPGRIWILVPFLLTLTACGGEARQSGEEPPLSAQSRAKLEAILERYGAIDPDPGDAESVLEAKHEQWKAKLSLADWARTHEQETGGSMWGTDCETRCWADWWLCVDTCPKDDGGMHLFSGSLPGDDESGETGDDATPLADSGLGSDPDDCWSKCDRAHDRCLRKCEIMTELRP